MQLMAHRGASGLAPENTLASFRQCLEYAPEWIELALEAGRRVAFRPMVQEAVAPYAAPETPPERTLSADEAQAALRRDWLHQIGGRPTLETMGDELRAARGLPPVDPPAPG